MAKQTLLQGLVHALARTVRPSLPSSRTSRSWDLGKPIGQTREWMQLLRYKQDRGL